MKDEYEKLTVKGIEQVMKETRHLGAILIIVSGLLFLITVLVALYGEQKYFFVSLTWMLLNVSFMMFNNQNLRYWYTKRYLFKYFKNKKIR